MTGVSAGPAAIDRIRCLCLDVDGVLTDGRLHMDESGRVARAYDIQDGLAIQLFARHMGEAIIISGKGGESIRARARELGIRHVALDSRDKLADLNSIVRELKLDLTHVAAIGDDLPDLPVLRACGYPIAPANAVPEVRAVATLVTQRAGGFGAVREAVEHLLRFAGHWQQVMQRFDPGVLDTLSLERKPAPEALR